MEFLIIAIIFSVGLILLISGSHIKSGTVSKLCYFIGTVGVIMAMYIAWPK
ncbi:MULTISPECIES: hypothetical protein [Companilactobacillus]|uniref:Exosortase n=1 Tax=Companilactobacillus keshanensis TaxID=2486003 RepID=A0ABW4BTW8_9LACO|nr:MULTISPECIES: hypothetical protein [Companilactobacillus]